MARPIFQIILATGLLFTIPVEGKKGPQKVHKKRGSKDSNRSIKSPPTRRRRANPARVTRAKRRNIEPIRRPKLRPQDLLHTMVVREPGCLFRVAPRLRQRLSNLKNSSQSMSLEVWGDKRFYQDKQRVYFFFRSPRPSYVTLFWLGPKNAVVMPIINQKIPAHQDVRMDSGGIIVAPFGTERWVAINTTERIPISCASSAHVRMALLSMLRVPHGIGRWTVKSGPKPVKTQPLVKP